MSPPSLRKDTALESIETALSAAIEVERESHRLVTEAQGVKTEPLPDNLSDEDRQKRLREQHEAVMSAQGRLPVLLQAYGKALDNRLSVEERILELKERYGQLVTADFCRNLLRKAWIPHLARLRSISKRAAPKAAAAADEVLVDKIISDEIEDSIREAQSSFEIPPGPMPPPR